MFDLLMIDHWAKKNPNLNFKVISFAIAGTDLLDYRHPTFQDKVM